jgi:hypothetical protein
LKGQHERNISQLMLSVKCSNIAQIRTVPNQA